MKKYSLKYFLVPLVVMLFVTGCSDLSETNIDPTRPTSVEIRLILPSAISQSAFNIGSNPARVAGIIMQQYVGFDAQQVAYTDYVLPDITFNNYWRTGLYAAVLKDCNDVINLAQEEARPHYEGIAKILMAHAYGNATSYFGDIPFSEALKGAENLTPSYDSQEAVYAGVLRLLDEAITLLNGASSAGPPASDDLIYGGDAASWVATAYALKARYTMQQAKRNPNAGSDVLAALANAFGDLASQPNFNFGSGQLDNWALAKFGNERPNTLIIDSRFADWMTNNADPRQDFYMEFNGSEWVYFNSANPNLVWATNNASVPLISYVEVKFLEAEALALDGAATADIQAALAAGITASMDQIGVAAADYADYVANHSDLSGLSDAEVIQRIIEEAYVAYYGYAFHQTWANYRRTGYPALTPSPAGAGGLNPSGVIPRRYLYPSSEDQTNSANLQAAQAAQNGALLDADMWAFQ